jgi:hypothetical protein
VEVGRLQRRQARGARRAEEARARGAGGGAGGDGSGGGGDTGGDSGGSGGGGRGGCDGTGSTGEAWACVRRRIRSGAALLQAAALPQEAVRRTCEAAADQGEWGAFADVVAAAQSHSGFF